MDTTRNIIKDSIGTIIGNDNDLKIFIEKMIINKNDKIVSGFKTLNLKLSRLITFAKNHYAKVAWGRIFQSFNEDGQPNNADIVIREVFSASSENDYPSIFKIIKKMYPNLSSENLSELKEIFSLFGIDYDTI